MAAIVFRRVRNYCKKFQAGHTILIHMVLKLLIFEYSSKKKTYYYLFFFVLAENEKEILN